MSPTRDLLSLPSRPPLFFLGSRKAGRDTTQTNKNKEVKNMENEYSKEESDAIAEGAWNSCLPFLKEYREKGMEAIDLEEVDGQ